VGFNISFPLQCSFQRKGAMILRQVRKELERNIIYKLYANQLQKPQKLLKLQKLKR